MDHLYPLPGEREEKVEEKKKEKPGENKYKHLQSLYAMVGKINESNGDKI